jgi:hypothetical protein
MNFKEAYNSPKADYMVLDNENENEDDDEYEAEKLGRTSSSILVFFEILII